MPPAPMPDLPEWTTFEPGAPPVLPEHAERPGRLVAIVATATAREEGWATDVTVEIAKAWSQSGHKVVVADTALAAATIHERMGTDNAEGVSDTVLFGSSVRRVARPTPEGVFFVISAGTATADPAAVLDSARWRRLCSGFLEAGVTLISYVGAESEGMTSVLEMATDVIVLTGANESAVSAVDGTSAPIRAVTGRTRSDDASPVAIDVDDGRIPVPPVLEETEVPVTPGDGVPGQAAEEGWNESADASLPEAEATIMEAADVEAPPARTGTRRSVLLVAILVLVATVAAAAFGWVEIPGISPSPAGDPADESIAPVAPSVPNAPVTSTLAYSVTVGAFQDADAAATRAVAMSREGVFLTTAPVLIDGVLYHRVLLGPATDSASAESLADRIAAETGEDRSEWVVRETRVAFKLGEMADLAVATRRRDVLRGLGVPAYVLAIDFADQSTRYRVYAGAYSDEREASYMMGHLESRGLDNATLSERLGRVL